MADNILHSGSFVDRNGNEISITFFKRSSHTVMYTDPVSMSFGNTASTIRLKVYNSSGTLSISKSSGATWLSYSSRGSASGYKYYDISVTNNSNSYIRNAVLTLTDSYNTITVSVTQAATISSISVSPTSLSFAYGGETKTVTVTWEGGNTPTYTFPTWCTVSTSGSTSPMTVTVTAAANTGGTRYSTVDFSNGLSTCSLDLEQGAAHTVTVSPNPMNFTAAGGTQELTISGISGSFSMNYDYDFISLEPTYTSSTVRKYNVTCNPNTVTQTRTCSINVTDSYGVWVTVTVNQAANSDTFAVSPTSFEYAGSGASNTFTFTGVPAGGISYDIPSAAQSWVTASNFSNSSITLTAAANDSINSRSAVVTVYDMDDNTNYVTITMNQEAGQSSLSVSPTSITYLPSGGTYGVDVTWTGGTTPTATITYVQGDPGWLTAITPSPNNGTMSMAWTAASNYDGSSRTALIRITNGLQTETVTVSQSSAPSPAVWSVVPSSITGASTSGNTYSITFSNAPSSVDYSISYVDGSNWITVSGLSSSGASITLGANSGASSRSATVLFIDDNDPTNYVSVSIDQNGTVTPALSVMPSSFSFDGEGERKSNVINNIVGTLTHTYPSWITISESGSGGSRLVSVTAASNSGTSRNGYLVYDDDRNNPVTVALAQGTFPQMTVTPSEQYFLTPSASSMTITVEHVYGSLTTYHTVNWISLGTPQQSGNTWTYNAQISANTSTSAKSNYIGFRDGRGSVYDIDMPVYQAGTAGLSVTPSSLAFSSTSGSDSITVRNHLGNSVTASTAQSWISLNTVNYDTYYRVNVGVTDNSSGAERSGSIIIDDARETPVTVAVTQSGPHIPVLSASPSQFNFSSSSQSSQLDVYYEGTLLTNATGGQGWLSVLSGVDVSTGHKRFTVSVTENSVYTSRSATIDLEDDYNTIAVPVTQDPGEPILLVSPNRMDFPATLSYSLATVTYPSTLSVSVSIEYNSADTGWINVELANPVSGDTRTYTIDVESNDGPNSEQEREAMIAFEGELGGADEIYVYQSGQN